jgi:Histidinol phosphatase and related hydrolases of the PHP family
VKIVVDTHTHSISSGHAYSTVQEMAREAQTKGIEMFALTDHGPDMIGAPQLYHFGNLKVLPPELYGVKILKGVEANILDYTGEIDLPVDYLKRLDFVLASLHDGSLPPGTVEENTQAIINLLKNPLVDTVGHLGNPVYPIDIDKVILAAKEYRKPIELNNSSFYFRKGSAPRCQEIALKCKNNNVPIVCGSDAHISFDVGKFDKVSAVLAAIEMPEELVLNSSVARFEAYLKQRRQAL